MKKNIVISGSVEEIYKEYSDTIKVTEKSLD